MIIFRTDGNSDIGLGHVMRCLSIADAFKENGESCLFITADNKLHKTIKERGHKNQVLGTEYNHMEDELEQFLEEIEKRDVQIIFVDSYYVTEHYLQTLWQFCAMKYITLVYIDDVLAFPYPCDVLLNYNIYACDKDYQKLYAGHSIPELLLNTSYQPIRTEFKNLPNRVVREEGKDILISTGGADAEHMGLEIVKTIIAHDDWKGHNFHFIIGMMNNDAEEIETLVDGKDNIILHRRVKKMSELMQSCDVAISAAGSTIYELCSTQTPSLTYILADNQISGAEGFEKKGILKSAGDIREIGARNLAEKVLSDAVALANDYEKRIEIASRMATIVDGKGTERIVEAVSEAWNQQAIEQIVIFIEHFNMHYNLLLRRYKRFKEVDDPQSRDIDVLTYLDIILVQLRSICLEHEKYKNNYTAQNLLHRLGRDDLAQKIDAMLEEQFFEYRDGCTIKEAIKILTDDYVCHYDSFEKDDIIESSLIEQQLRNPYINHNLDYIMKTLIDCIGEGLSIKNFLDD